MIIPIAPAPDRKAQDAPASCREAGLQAEITLRRGAYPAPRDVACDARAGGVRLRGRLGSYGLEQVARAIVSKVEGVLSSHNPIEVVPPPRSPQGRGRNTA